MRDDGSGVRQAARDLVTGSACLGCGAPGPWWCPGCRDVGPTVPARPEPRPPGLRPAVAGAAYDGVVAAAVVAHKERGAVELASPLGVLLGAAVADLVRALGPDPRATVLLVPVPSRPGASRRRGGDPLLRLARVATRALRREDGLPDRDVRLARLLRHRGGVADQGGLDAAARSRNLVGSLAVPTHRLRRWSGRTVVAVVVDDVMTTGATALEAQRALQATGVPVLGCAVAAATVKRLSAHRT